MNVRSAAVVRHDLRHRASLREQGVQQPDGGRVLARLAGDHDGIQLGAMRAQPRHVTLRGGSPVERVPIPQRLNVSHADQAFPSGGPAGVYHLGAGRERLQQVITKTALTPVGRLS